jgi:glycosyltransferase involved in cell wall biosynthesis
MTLPVEVTFVVPNYNGAPFLGQTLESILGQRDPAFSVVVADNCSTDGSIEIARSYRDDRLTVALADVHVSMSENWNRALGYARTPYAVLAHADDVYEPDYLGVMLPLIRGHATAFCAHCKVAYIDEHGHGLDLPLERYKDRFWPEIDPYCRPACEEAAWLRRGNYILAPSAIYRMDGVRAIGAFNTRFQFVPDWEYWLRGVFAGYQIVGTRRKLVKYRKHSRSLTSTAEANLSRYQEEIDLLRWLAVRGFSAGCFPDERPEYGLVSNTIMTEFADRLARGDSDGATRLAVFGRANIPRFRWSTRDITTRCALPLGVAGGRALVGFRELYLRHMSGRPRGRTSWS